MSRSFILLPELDGTANLFQRFIETAPPDITAPRWRVLRWFILPILFTLRPQAFLLRRYMVGSQTDDTLVRDVATAVASVPAKILAYPQSVITVDKTEAFRAITVPTLYLRGTEDRLGPESAVRRMAAARSMTVVRYRQLVPERVGV